MALILIDNVTIFSNDAYNSVLTDHAVVIEQSRIKAVLPARQAHMKYPGASRIDGRGRLLMPGLVNAHMHFYGTFARGLAIEGTPRDFHDILKMLWWQLDASLDPEGVYYSTLIPAITAAKRGVTAIIDHHASPHAVAGSLDQVEAAMALVGLRGIFCYEISDRDGSAIREAGLAENRRYAAKCNAARKADPDHLYDAMIGLHASFTLQDDTLAEAGRMAAELQKGCHIHVWEDRVDGELTRQRYHAGVVERLLEYGILGPQSIAAHGIYLQDDEKQILADSETFVVHNPQSNMNNAVGRADIFDLLQRGIIVGLGSDGMSPDMRPDARTANLLHKHDLGNSGAGWIEIQQMLLKNNPAIYQRISSQPVGRIAPGWLADIILIDYFPPTPMNGDNFWGHFLFGIADAPVSLTMVNGTIIMEDGKIPGIDEIEVAEKSRRVAEDTWRRFRR